MIVYLLTNLINGKRYVGQTTSDRLPRYIERVFRSAELGRTEKCILYNAIRKYGRDSFEVRELVNIDSNLPHAKALLDAWEIGLIAIWNLRDHKKGYNITAGGGGSFGVRGRIKSPETRAKIGAAGKGRKASEETKRKMSESQKGRTHSLETRLKISESNLGRRRAPFSLEMRRNMSESHKGKKHTPETLQKMSLAQKKRGISPELRAKLNAGRTGKSPKLTPETRIKFANVTRLRNHIKYHVEKGIQNPKNCLICKALLNQESAA